MRAITAQQSTLKKVELECRRCGARYYTKNIDYVGARQVFPIEGGKGCAHPMKDLVVIEPKERDVQSFKEELELCVSQGRTQTEIDSLFLEKYGYVATHLVKWKGGE